MISKSSNIAIIGAGKIAYSLVNALIKNDYKVKLIVSNNIDSAKKLARKFSVNDYSDNLTILNNKIKVVFIAVPDNQIKLTAGKITKLNLNFRNSLFIHLSGAEDISQLNSLRRAGALTASFHIMQTFPSKGIIKIENCYASIETGNKTAERFLFKLSKELKLKSFKLNSKDKIRYHLSGVFASNFLVGNIFDSEKVFDLKKKKNSSDNFEFLSPIIESTFNNIFQFGTSKALSGPIERGDIITVKKHMSELKKKKFNVRLNYILFSYIIQSLNLLNVVESKYGKLSKTHLEIKKYLQDEFRKTYLKKSYY